MKVSSFGIHEDKDGIRWLLQETGAANAVGLSGTTDLSVDRRRCNHQIDLDRPSPSPSEWNAFMRVVRHPLLNLMLPIPRRAKGVFYVTGGLEELRQWERMSSPINPTVLPMWVAGKRTIYDDLQSSNIQPLVIFGVKGENTVFLRELGDYTGSMPRTLLYLADEPGTFRAPTNATRIRFSDAPIDAHAEWPWEQLGTEVVRRYMRGTWDECSIAV